jgi:hypothetical protein
LGAERKPGVRSVMRRAWYERPQGTRPSHPRPGPGGQEGRPEAAASHQLAIDREGSTAPLEPDRGRRVALPVDANRSRRRLHGRVHGPSSRPGVTTSPSTGHSPAGTLPWRRTRPGTAPARDVVRASRAASSAPALRRPRLHRPGQEARSCCASSSSRREGGSGHGEVNPSRTGPGRRSAPPCRPSGGR